MQQDLKKGGLAMNVDKIEELRRRIADLKQRLPAHSVKPAMLLELEDLEEELERLIKRGKDRQNQP